MWLQRNSDALHMCGGEEGDGRERGERRGKEGGGNVFNAEVLLLYEPASV